MPVKIWIVGGLLIRRKDNSRLWIELFSTLSIILINTIEIIGLQ